MLTPVSLADLPGIPPSDQRTVGQKWLKVSKLLRKCQKVAYSQQGIPPVARPGSVWALPKGVSHFLDSFCIKSQKVNPEGFLP